MKVSELSRHLKSNKPFIVFFAVFAVGAILGWVALGWSHQKKLLARTYRIGADQAPRTTSCGRTEKLKV